MLKCFCVGLVIWGFLASGCSSSKSHTEAATDDTATIDIDSDSAGVTGTDHSDTSYIDSDTGDVVADSQTEETEDTDTRDEPFRTWEKMLTSLESSPDNLPERAKQLTEPQDIFEFVRDSIQVFPPDVDGVDYMNMLNTVHWGTRATLRGGAGTPREKVDLLAVLLNKIGTSATVYDCLTNSTLFSTQDMLLTKPTPIFQPEADTAALEKWKGQIGVVPPELAIIDTHVALAAQLQAELPDGIFDTDTVFDWSGESFHIPIVGIPVSEDDTVFLNPLLPTSQWGDYPCTNTPYPEDAAERYDEISIRLEVGRNFDRYDRELLFEGTWSAADVAGRRLRLSFPQYEGGSFQVPAVSVPNSDVETQYGNPLSRLGNILTVSEDNRVMLDGASLGNIDSTVDPSVVSSLDMSVSANAYPSISIGMSVMDAAGNNVAGLGADAIELTENDVPVPFVLKRNVVTPKVLLLFDDSDSIPEEYRGEPMRQLGNDIASAVWETQPDVLFRVASVWGIAAFQGDWTNDSAELDAQLEKNHGMESYLWKALEYAIDQTDASLIVYVTDGDPTDELSPVQAQVIRNGPPVFTVGVGEYFEDFLNQLEEMTGGRSFTPENTDEAAAAIVAEISEMSNCDYEIEYMAPSDGSSERTVTVTINDVSASRSYTVPENVEANVSTFSGLFLSVKVGNDEIERVLAGFDPDSHLSSFEPDADLMKRMTQDVMNVLHGNTVFAVEAGPPNLSVVLSEMLQEKMTMKDAWMALQENNNTAWNDALEKGFFVTPPELFIYGMSRDDRDDPDSLTYVPHINVNSVTTYPVDGVGLVKKTDLTAINEWVTIRRDGQNGWQENLKRTSWSAMAEAALNSESTYHSIGGNALAFMESRYDSRLDDLGLERDLEIQWEWLLGKMDWGNMALMPQAGSPMAFWQIDGDNGTLTGMLSDYTGGGQSVAEISAHFDEVIFALSTIEIAAMGSTLGAFAGLEKVKAEALKKATIAIATMDGSGEDWNQVVEDMLCSYVKAGLGATLPPVGNAFDAEGVYDYARDYMGLSGPDAFPCPW